MTRDRNDPTADAFAYFASRAGAHGYDMPLSMDAYRAEKDRRARTSSQGPHGRSYVVEIITDPDDLRGLNARRINAL
jgi:hypothetical protein